MQEIGRYLAAAGLIIFGIGLLIFFAGEKFSWFGNLPGDIKIKKENFSFYMPLASMLLVSVALSAFIWLLRKLF